MYLKPKNLILFTATVAISSFAFAGCSQQPKENNINLNQTQMIDQTPTVIPTPELTSTPSVQTVASSTESIVSLQTKDGEIVIKLYDKIAPNTVANFMKKVQSSFYSGLIFHRVIPGFMAQGGDPLGTGTGGGTITSEINNLPFKKGTIGLARGPIKEESNDSQFFICYDDTGCQHLTGDYVNFGEVTSGFDVLNNIKQGDKIIQISNQTK